ncbi:unnamed protein product [Rhizoctonia solani]|nr:unnamed protein product [Rhizoctonia solani]
MQASRKTHMVSMTGKSQEDTQVCNREANAESQRYSSVSEPRARGSKKETQSLGGTPGKRTRRNKSRKRKRRKRRLFGDSSSLFFQHNTALAPPYRVLIDTNFINFSLQNKLELVQGMMDCLYAKYCVIAELEKLGPKYRIALRVARDPRFERLPCSHEGTYADDCLVQRVTASKCYIVATCDRELRRRVPGVPLMYIVRRRYAIERLPDQGAPA